MNIDGEIINKIQLYLKIKKYMKTLENELIELLVEKLAENEETEE
jgi:hypothetical protein